jgi:hypothetical protein
VKAVTNTGTMTIDGNLNWNTLVGTTKTTFVYGDCRVFNSLKNLTIHGDIAHNSIDATGVNRAIGWNGNQGGSVFILDGDFDNNTFTSLATNGNATGMILRSSFTLTGNYSNNDFDIETQGTAAHRRTQAILFTRTGGSSSVASGGAIDGNTFAVTSNATEWGIREEFNSSFSLYNIQNNDFSGVTGTGKLQLNGGGTVNIYGASDATNLASQNTGITAGEIADNAVTYIP